MAYHQDWFMRQIRQLIEAIARVLLGKELRVEQLAHPQWQRLQSLMKEKGICAAEDYLLEHQDPRDRESLEAGLRFYQTVNELLDEELEAQNFSREEIREGLSGLCAMAGMPELEHMLD